jgi:soluble P-type ATPase
VVPGSGSLDLRHLVLDFNGTLALDGALLPGVATRLRVLAKQLTVTVLTADTFGTAGSVLGRLPVTVQRIRAGADKRRFVARQPRGSVIAIGNGRNDVPMMQHAALGVAVLGPEGTFAGLLARTTVVTRNITDALDLLLFPKRLVATLRK